MRSSLTDVDVQLHAQTDKAWKVSTTGKVKDAVWVPKSQGDLEMARGSDKTGVLTLPEGLAVEKGLV